MMRTINTRTSALRVAARWLRDAAADLWHEMLAHVHHASVGKQLTQTRLAIIQVNDDIRGTQCAMAQATHDGHTARAEQLRRELSDLEAWRLDLDRQACRLRQQLVDGPA